MGKVISRRAESKSPQRLHRILNIREFNEKRNQILIIRAVGGLGDILMHRMIFEDIKIMMPDAEIHFACPYFYHEALVDHPFLDKILDSAVVNKMDYIISYNTSTACGRYEMRIAPLSDLHRSDIWADHCGLKLTKHNMHIRLTEEEKSYGKRKLDEVRDRLGPIVLVCPISAMGSKNLLDHQLIGLVDGLYERGCCVIGLHNDPIMPLVRKNVPCLCGFNVRQWMSIIHEADYIVSVDTASFHCAGGMGKPVTGIFTWACGKAYGQHYPTANIVQLHRDTHKEWTCGPCYNWCNCPKSTAPLKPCLTELTTNMILAGVDKMLCLN